MSFYAVKNGRKPGIYDTWAECEAQVKSFSGAVYKKFTTKQEALNFIGMNKYMESEVRKDSSFPEGLESDVRETSTNKDLIIAYVDGFYNKFSQKYGSGIVTIYDGKVRKSRVSGQNKDLLKHLNVAGELIASMNAINIAKSLNKKVIEVKYDYAGIEKWATDCWKANTELTKKYKDYVNENKLNLNIKFKKIEAHTGNEGNEMADRLAKSAISENISILSEVI